MDGSIRRPALEENYEMTSRIAYLNLSRVVSEADFWVVKMVLDFLRYDDRLTRLQKYQEHRLYEPHHRQRELTNNAIFFIVKKINHGSMNHCQAAFSLHIDISN